MGGGAIVGAAIGLYSAYQQGEAEKDAADATAADIQIQAEADVEDINQELEDALSMQQVLFGSQGKVIEGSAVAVMEGDKAAAADDIADIREAAARGSTAVTTAGRIGRRSAHTAGLLSAVGTYSQYSNVGSSSDKQVK